MQDLGNRMTEYSDSKGFNWEQMPYRQKVAIYKNHMVQQRAELQPGLSQLIRQAMASDPYGSSQ